MPNPLSKTGLSATPIGRLQRGRAKCDWLRNEISGQRNGREIRASHLWRQWKILEKREATITIEVIDTSENWNTENIKK